MKKIALVMLLVGVVGTALSARSEYVFCVDGPGRGQPFAITHPAHGPAFLEIPFEGDSDEGMVFDSVGTMGDIAIWGVLAGLPLTLPYALLMRRRRRKAAAIAVALRPTPWEPHPLSIFQLASEEKPAGRADRD